ncbi:hypothetical protein DI270_019040 [Microbispora triticiradicis]|uniref:DJ-1/PfpI domain-containing protein n=3 Tax=Microbispora TaxID=2005 RepID=A0ABY3LQ69_9ACTN|nr:hypothetical protein DI270_019040 [Microbispora triticiradicis]TLP51264.1 hypothetical protein FED44_34535 [Microbispora fusca]TYB47158.1 hypothetical protein FXF59_30575 [Microbispora tritici]
MAQLKRTGAIGAVTIDDGLTVQVEHSLREMSSGDDEIDTMIVIGGNGVFDPTVSAEVVRELPALARRSRRVTSVCAGSLLLAAAGLLDGYRATTHWSSHGCSPSVSRACSSNRTGSMSATGAGGPRRGLPPASISCWRWSRTTTAPRWRS